MAFAVALERGQELDLDEVVEELVTPKCNKAIATK